MARRIQVEIVGDSRSLERTFGRSARAARGFNADLGRASRGAISAAVSFRGLGRTLAFGSAQFLGGAGIVFAIKSTISAAEESQKVLAQTENAVTRSGLSWAKYGAQIQEAALAQSNLSGFDDERLLGTFTNLVRRTGDVTQALKLNALAADVARGRNISLEAAQQLVLKASIGNVGALRRLGINVGKSASAYQALDLLQRKYAGSAAAYGRTAAGAQDRFGVALENTQELLGSDAIPAITKYLNKGADWLSQSKNQARIQRDVSQAVRLSSGAIKDISEGVKTASDAVGGFKNTLKLLLALKVSSVLVGWGANIGLIGTKAQGSTTKVSALRGALTRLGAIGAITVAIDIVANAHTTKTGLHRYSGSAGWGNLWRDIVGNVKHPFALLPKQFPPTNTSGMSNDPLHDAADRIRNALDLTGPLGDLSGIARQRKKGVTATQRNTFFDNALTRSLDRVQDLGLAQQIGKLKQISGLIQARIAATKDVTRKLNLEDKLVGVNRQIKDVQGQIADQIKQAAEDAKQKMQDATQALLDSLQFGLTKAQATAGFADDLRALDALQAGIKQRIGVEGKTLDLQRQLFDVQQQIAQARTDQLTSKQFRQLGLTATGDEITPGVANLKKRLGTITADVSGSFLDTKKVQSQLARFRKVLSEGLVPKDVRAKIKEMLDGIRDELNKGAHNLTKFKAIDTSKFLANLGLDLTPAQLKAARAQLSQLGAGGTLPRSSLAAAGAGGGDIVIHHTTKLDGRVVENVVTRHQQTRRRRNPPQKRGPHAGI